MGNLIGHYSTITSIYRDGYIYPFVQKRGSPDKNIGYIGSFSYSLPSSLFSPLATDYLLARLCLLTIDARLEVKVLPLGVSVVEGRSGVM